MGCTNSGMVHENATKLVQNVKDLNEKGEHLINDVETTVMKGFDDIKETITDIEKETKHFMGTLTGENEQRMDDVTAPIDDNEVMLVDDMKVIEIAESEDGDDGNDGNNGEKPMSPIHEPSGENEIEAEPRNELESHRSVDDSLGEIQSPQEVTESTVSSEVLDTENTNM